MKRVLITGGAGFIAHHLIYHILKTTNWDGFQGALHIGWEYVILRKEFSKMYQKPNNLIPNILISMGATDIKQMTEFVVGTLDLIDEPFTTTIIIGPGFQNENDLKSQLDSVHYKYTIYFNPDNISKIMSRSNLAIISFGVTAYELTALNVPALYLFKSNTINKKTNQYFL